MGEITTKKTTAKRNKWNSAVVKKVSEEYEVSEYFVRESLRGNKTSRTAEKIKKQYEALCKAQKEAFENTLNK